MRKWGRATQGKNGRTAGRGAVIELRMDAATGFKRKNTSMRKYNLRDWKKNTASYLFLSVL